MKKALFVTLLIFFTANTYSQTWQPVGKGVTGHVNSLFVYDSVMYLGGRFASPGNNIAQWNDTILDSVSSGTNNEVYSFGYYKGLVYVGGWFSKAGGHSAGSIATWNGTSFANAGFDVEGGNYELGVVNGIHQYDSLLYIGGQFDSVNHKHLSGLLTWNGKKFDSLHTFYGGSYTDVSIFTVFKNLLYYGFAPGYYGGLPIFTWNNIIDKYGSDYFCNTVASGDIYMNAFCIYDSNLYLGGNFLYYYHNSPGNRDTVHNIANWNDKKWLPLGKGIHGTINALVVYDSLLIAAGGFDSAGGIPVNNIAAWNGITWSAFGTGFNGPINALAVFDSNLYAGGSFTSPGNGIAEYKFVPIKKIIPEINNNDSINVFPSPNTGSFTVVCNRVITAATQPIIEIYNILGEKIYSANLSDGNNTITLVKPTRGMYFYKIYNSTGNLINPGKLVIE